MFEKFEKLIDDHIVSGFIKYYNYNDFHSCAFLYVIIEKLKQLKEKNSIDIDNESFVKLCEYSNALSSEQEKITEEKFKDIVHFLEEFESTI